MITSLALLEQVARTQPAGVSALARSLELPKTTVHRGLQALSDAGWIRPSGSDMTRWVLTTRALTVGRHVGGEVIDRAAALAAMRFLNEATNETIHLNLLDDREIVLIERIDARQPVVTSNPIGLRAPLHSTSNGKAILAAMSDERVDRYLSAGPLEARTSRTIVDPERLREELTAIRVRGYSTNLCENSDEVSAVAAAILASDNQPVGGISISAPAHRISEDCIPWYGQLVTEAARTIHA